MIEVQLRVSNLLCKLRERRHVPAAVPLVSGSHEHKGVGDYDDDRKEKYDARTNFSARCCPLDRSASVRVCAPHSRTDNPTGTLNPRIQCHDGRRTINFRCWKFPQRDVAKLVFPASAKSSSQSIYQFNVSSCISLKWCFLLSLWGKGPSGAPYRVLHYRPRM